MIFNENNPKVCGLCRHARPLFDKKSMACARKGVVRHNYSCGKFEYDPLKRQPSPKNTPEFPPAEEFQL